MKRKIRNYYTPPSGCGYDIIPNYRSKWDGYKRLNPSQLEMIPFGRLKHKGSRGSSGESYIREFWEKEQKF